LDNEIIADIAPNQHGYRDAAEILSEKLHAMFVNILKVTAPPVIYDIETLMVYMMDGAPTHLADLMTTEFTQGYMAGFVMATIDEQQAQIEYAAELAALGEDTEDVE
jgi:hypothetical protein